MPAPSRKKTRIGLRHGGGIGALMLTLIACQPASTTGATASSATASSATASSATASSATASSATAANSSATIASARPSATAASTTSTGSPPATSNSPTAGNSAAASVGFDPDALAGMTEPPLFGPDGNFLEQTEDEPSIESVVFKDRLDNLFRAIQQNDPEIARSFFFPVQAYEKVKAIDKAAADWRWRLYKRFKRDIKRYHKRLGEDPEQAKLLRVQLRRKPQWMKPGREGNRIGYYRVTRSWLHFETAEGEEKHFEITSMISWRGQWYVVHLHGFK